MTTPRRLMLFAAGIAAMAWGLFSLSSHLPSMFYSTARGKVISATIDHVVVGRISLHSPRIRYEYRVNGNEYVNDQYGPSTADNEGTDEWAHRIVRSFPGTEKGTSLIYGSGTAAGQYQ